jgi:endosialidase-like protein
MSNELYIKRIFKISDERCKDVINESDKQKSLNAILNISIKDYIRKDDPDKNICTGIIAQELKLIIPNIVHTGEFNEIPDFHVVEYTGLISYLIQSIQLLNEKINILNEKIEKLSEK